MQVLLHSVYDSKIREIFPCWSIFHTCLSIFRITESPLSIAEFFGQTELRLNVLAFDTKEVPPISSWTHPLSSSFKYMSSRTLNTVLWTNTSLHTHTHKQEQIQYFAFSHTFTYTVSHTAYPHEHIKSQRVVLTAECRQLLDCVSFWQAGGAASTALPVNTTWPWTVRVIIIKKTKQNKKTCIG